MNGGATLYVVAWLVVYPLLLALALVVARIGYQRVRERGTRAAYMETTRRAEEKQA